MRANQAPRYPSSRLSWQLSQSSSDNLSPTSSSLVKKGRGSSENKMATVSIGKLACCLAIVFLIVLATGIGQSQAKIHHSKRQAPSMSSNAQFSSQQQTIGRENTNWWNLWWQQYINEAVQPTVKPIVAVNFNGRTISVNDQAASESAGSGTNIIAYPQMQQVGSRTPELAENSLQQNEMSRVEQQYNSQQALLQRKSIEQQQNWKAVRPMMIQTTRDARTNRQINEAVPFQSALQMRNEMQKPTETQPQQLPKLASNMIFPTDGQKQRQRQSVANNNRRTTTSAPTIDEMLQFEQQQNQMIDYSEENEADMENIVTGIMAMDGAGESPAPGAPADSSSSSMMQELRPRGMQESIQSREQQRPTLNTMAAQPETDQPSQSTTRAGQQTQGEISQMPTSQQPSERTSPAPSQSTSSATSRPSSSAIQTSTAATTTTTRSPTTVEVETSETPISLNESGQPMTQSTQATGRVELKNGRPATGFRQGGQATTNSARLPTRPTTKTVSSAMTPDQQSESATTPLPVTRGETSSAFSSEGASSTTMGQLPGTASSHTPGSSSAQAASTPTTTTNTITTTSQAPTQRPDSQTPADGRIQAQQTTPSPRSMTTISSWAGGNETTSSSPTTTTTTVPTTTTDDSESDDGDDEAGTNDGGSLSNAAEGDDSDDSDDSESAGDSEPTTTISSMTAGAGAESADNKTATETKDKLREQPQTQPVSPAFVTMDLERLPKGMTAMDMLLHSNGTMQGGDSGKRPNESETTTGGQQEPAQPNQEDLARLRPPAGGGNKQRPDSNFVMMTLDPGRATMDGDTAITVPMNTLMKMVMNQIAEDEREQQLQMMMGGGGDVRPTTPKLTSDRPEDAMTRTTPLAGRQGSTTATSTSAEVMRSTLQASIKNADISAARSSPAPPMTTASDASKKMKKLQPPPTTQMPAEGSASEQAQPEVSTMAPQRMEPKIELINLDLAPIQRVISQMDGQQSTAASSAPATMPTTQSARPQQKQTQTQQRMFNANMPMEVEPGMRLRPPQATPMQAQSPSMGTGRSGQASSTGVNVTPVSGLQHPNTMYMLMMSGPGTEAHSKKPSPTNAMGSRTSPPRLASTTTQQQLTRSSTLTTLPQQQTKTTPAMASRAQQQSTTGTLMTTGRIATKTVAAGGPRGTTLMRITPAAMIGQSTTPLLPTTFARLRDLDTTGTEGGQTRQNFVTETTITPATAPTPNTTLLASTTTGEPAKMGRLAQTNQQAKMMNGQQPLPRDQSMSSASGAPATTIATPTTTISTITTVASSSDGRDVSASSQATTATAPITTSAPQQQQLTQTTTFAPKTNISDVRSGGSQSTATSTAPATDNNQRQTGSDSRMQQQTPANSNQQSKRPPAFQATKSGSPQKAANSTSTFIPGKLRDDFGRLSAAAKTSQRQQTEGNANSSNATSRIPQPTLAGSDMSAAIRQFGGANRMSALSQKPVAFGRPAAMTMQATHRRPEIPTFEYGPSIAVRRPDEPLANGQVPNCTLTGKNFCVLTKDYPMNEVRQAVERSFRSVRIMYEELQTVSDQELHRDDFGNTTQNQAASGKFACETQVEMMRPGWARDEITKEWMLVVNTDVFPQRVRTESCAQPNTPCEFIAPFYDSTCQQRYSLHRMIAIDPHDPSRSPQVAVFKFPAGCVCRVHPIRKSSPNSSSSPTTTPSGWSGSTTVRRRRKRQLALR